jgi:hypothetical protein
MGNPQLMTAKIMWDFAIYWGFLTLQFVGGRLCDLDLIERAGNILQRVNHLNARMQAFFREWDSLGQQPCEPAFIDVLDVDIMRRFHYQLEDDLPGEALLERFRENLKLCESLAAAIFQEAARRLPNAPEAAVNPYALTLALDEESLFDSEKAVAVEEIAAGSMKGIRLNPLKDMVMTSDPAYAG